MKYVLKEMTEMEKPREKLYYYGANSLSNYELLAIILRTGTKEKSVIDLSIELLKQINTINDFHNITIEELLKIKGIGKIKAIELLAIIEFSKRINSCDFKQYYIKSAKDCYKYLKNKLSFLDQEHFVAIYLSINNKVILDKTISIGTSNKMITDPKDVIKWGIKVSAYGVIISHNHPSGDVIPSNEDIMFTHSLEQACKTVDLIFIDHIIVGKNKYFSFKQKSIFNE